MQLHTPSHSIHPLKSSDWTLSLQASRDMKGKITGVTVRSNVKVARLQSEFCINCFLGLRILRKMVRNFPRFFLSLYIVAQKNPAKFPPNFLSNSLPKVKKSPTSFCRSAGRTNGITDREK